MPARALLHRYRNALAALALSVGVHAALIVGVPGTFGPGPEPEAATYSVELAPLPSAATAVSQQAAPAPAPAPRRARSPRKPTEAIASLPSLEHVASAVEGLPQLAEAPTLASAEPPSASAPPPPEETKPELLAAALPAAPVPALEPREFPMEALPASLSIHYQLTSPFADGIAEYSWSREGDRYTINGSAEATGFFTLFLEGRILQESRGRVTGTGLQPERFIERKPQGPEEGLAFDWAGRKVEFRRNDEVKQGSLADNTVDWLSMIFQLAHNPPRSGGAVPLKVYTQRKLYEFELKVLGVEELELPLGKVKALHLRHATNDPKETVDVWLGVEQHYLPVKLRYPVARNRFMVDQVATSITTR